MPDSQEDNSEPLHVFDLPQLYTHPSAPSLLDALDLLALPAPSWDTTPTTSSAEPKGQSTVVGGSVTQYLTTIIASRLSWLSSPSDREEVWTKASARLSERSGRTGMGAVSRSFRIPTGTGAVVDIVLHEPPLTSDNLGLKTWAASYLLSKRLCLVQSHIPALNRREWRERVRVLELGSGTGLVGISAATVWGAAGASVRLTDLPDIVPNLAKNVEANRESIEVNGGEAETSVLDWAEEAVGPDEGYSVILAADPLYSSEHPRLLVGTIGRYLIRNPDEARVVVELPLREGYTEDIEEFRTRLVAIGLRLLEQGDEVGYDDWGGGEDGGLKKVKCWWGIWLWANQSTHSEQQS